MTKLGLEIPLPEEEFIKPRAISSFLPVIKVIGVGGAGCNIVNNMINKNIIGVEFIASNTDNQSLENSVCLSNNKIQLGKEATKGLGAGSMPIIGCGAAKESMNDVLDHIKDANMLFVVAGMGGGTGTGAAPEIAKAAKELGILTIGIVTMPFDFEGKSRMNDAKLGFTSMEKSADALICIPNQNLFRMADEKTTANEAFSLADNFLTACVSGITSLMINPGLINLDFADIQSVMSDMGEALIGIGYASGENRAKEAVDDAIHNPLLDGFFLNSSNRILISIAGSNVTLFEIDLIINKVRNELGIEANIIFGSTPDSSVCDNNIQVLIIATADSKPQDNSLNTDEDNGLCIEKKYNQFSMLKGMKMGFLTNSLYSKISKRIKRMLLND